MVRWFSILDNFYVRNFNIAFVEVFKFVLKWAEMIWSNFTKAITWDGKYFAFFLFRNWFIWVNVLHKRTKIGNSFSWNFRNASFASSFEQTLRFSFRLAALAFLIRNFTNSLEFVFKAFSIMNFCFGNRRWIWDDEDDSWLWLLRHIRIIFNFRLNFTFWWLLTFRYIICDICLELFRFWVNIARTDHFSFCRATVLFFWYIWYFALKLMLISLFIYLTIICALKSILLNYDAS
jgi:hypothetical protein